MRDNKINVKINKLLNTNELAYFIFFQYEKIHFRTCLIQHFDREILFKFLLLKLVKYCELINLWGRLFHAFTALFC